MALSSHVTHVERRPASDTEIEAALRRILGVEGVYDAEEIVRILTGPGYGFEIKRSDGSPAAIAALTSLVQDLGLQITLVVERGQAKLVLYNVER